jgi:hypothetical protein
MSQLIGAAAWLVCGLVEGGMPGSFDQVIVGDSASVHAGAAATDLGAVAGS